jgi:hypothetical protein
MPIRLTPINMVYDSDHPSRSTHGDLEAEIAAVIVGAIANGNRHSSYKSLTGELPLIWVEAKVSAGRWRIVAWETGLVAVARFDAPESMTEADAMCAALRAWRGR